ncbi:hypothetical protein Tco_0662924, partial [Tanacetum coccineum]
VTPIIGVIQILGFPFVFRSYMFGAEGVLSPGKGPLCDVLADMELPSRASVVGPRNMGLRKEREAGLVDDPHPSCRIRAVARILL